MDAEVIRQYVELNRRKRELEAEARDVKARMDDLSGQIEADMIENAIDSLKVDGATVYLHRQMWVSPDSDAIIGDLQAAGLDDCVAVGHMRLNGLVREVLGEQNGDLEPFYDAYPAMRGKLKLAERIGVRVRG